MKQHKKTLKVATAIVLTVAMLGTLAGCGGGGGDAAKDSGKADGAKTIEGGFLGQIDAWPAYMAVNSDVAKQYGINMKMQFFDSGMPMIQTVPANQLAVMDVGSVPSLMAALRYDTPIIGIASDESPANAIVVREDNPALKHKGTNPQFPDMMGSAEDVKGKTILCTTVSSGHYTLSKYLEALGLSESDVTVKNLEQSQAIKAFETGEGDYLVLWTPYLYRAFEKGWKEVANGTTCGASALMLWLADPKMAKEDPETIAKVLAMNNVGVEKYQSDGEKLVPDIQSFFTDFAAMEVSEKDAKLDIKTHKFFTLDEQIEYIDSGKLKTSLEDAANFFVAQKKFTEDELKQLKDKDFCIDGSFLKKAKEIKPAK